MEPIRRPLTFDEVKRAHRVLAAQNPAYANMDLSTFARHANKTTGTDFFGAADVGMVGRAYKEFSTGFDKLLEPVSNVARSAGGKVGSMFGSRGEDIGEMVGESLPRGAIDTLTALGGMGMMATPGLQLPGAALAAAGLGSTFAKTATDTGSPLAGGVSAAATALLPKFAEFGIKKVLPISKAAGTATEKAVGGGLGGLVERGVEYGGAQAGGLVNEQLAQQGVSLASGQGWQNPLTPENIAQSAAGVLAFAPFDVPMLAKGYRTTKDGRVVPHDITSMFEKGSTARSLADFGRQQEALSDVQKRITETIVPPTTRTPVVETPKETAPDPYAYQGPVDDLSHGDAREVQGPPTMNPVEAINAVQDPQIKSALETFAKQMGPFQQTPIDSTVPVRENAKPAAQLEIPAEQFKVVNGFDQTSSGVPLDLNELTARMQELQDAWDITANAPTARRQIEQKMQALTEKYGVADFKPGVTKISEMSFKEAPTPLSENQPYVRDLLEKVDEVTGGDILQMASAQDVASKTMVVGKKGKFTDVDIAKQAALSSLADMAARLVGMPAGLRAQGEAGALMITGEKFLRSLFTQRGYDAPTIDRLTKIGLRSLTMFDAASRTKIVASANDKQNFHWSSVGGIENAVVALSERFFKAKDLEIPGLYFVMNHEMTHDLQMRLQNATPEQLAADPKLARYAKTFEEIKKLTPQEKTDLLVTLTRSVFPLDKLSKDAQTEMNKFFEERAGVYASGLGDIESLADIGALLGMGLASKNSATISELKDIARFSDVIFKDFQMGYYSDLTGVIDALGDFLDSVWQQDNLNQWGIKASPGVRGDAVKSIAKAATEVMKANLESEQGVRMLMEIANRQYPPLLGAGLSISRDQVLSLDQALRAGLVEDQLGINTPSKTNNLEFKNIVKDLEGMMFRPEDAERFNGVRPGLLSNLVPMNQMAAKYPVLRPVFDLAYSFRGESAKMANKLLRPFYDANGKIDEEFLVKMMRPGQVNDALNKLALLQNEVERGYNDAEFKEIAGKLSKEDQEFVKDAMNRIGQANVLAAKSRVEFFGKDVVNQMTHIVMTQAQHFGNVKLTEAMAGSIADAVWQKVSKDLPTTSFVNSIPPAVYAKLEQFASVMKPKAVEIADMVLGEGHQGKPWWSSEVRLGKWMLSWRDKDGKAHVLGFKSEKEQVERARKVESEGNRVTTWNRQDRMEAFRGLPGDAIERFAEADRVAFEAMLKAMEGDITPEQENDIRELFTPGQGAAMLTTPAQMQERQLVGGREETNLMEGVLHNLTSTAFGLAKRYVKGRMGVVLYAPELKQNPDLQNKMRIYLNDIVNMPGREFHTLKNMVFSHYMALNISSLVIEPTQNFVAHVPHLIRKGASVGEAYKHVFSGLRQAAAYAWGKGPKKIDNALKHSNILRAFDEDVIGLGFLQEITTFEDANFMAARDLATKGTVTSQAAKAAQLVKDVAYWGLHLSRNFYGLATKLNSVASFISGYDYAISKGMDHEQAYSFAKEGTQTTTQIGSRASRPLAIARMKEFAGVGGLAYTLQSYTFNMLSMAARWGVESISKSVPKDQQKQARKAFAVMMGTQAALGGAMGLPMTAGAIALIEEFFPDVEIHKGMREWFASLGGDDAGIRDLIADGAMNGLVNALGPFDLGSRMQMSSVMGINPYDGFSFQNIFGPAANMLTNYTKALSAGTTGDFYSLGRGLAPNSLKNVIDLVHNDFVERDKVGKLLFEPNGAELLSRVVGFKPKRLSKYYEQTALLKRSAEIDARQKQRFYEELADNVMNTGDWNAVRLALIQKSKETTGFDAREGARRIAEIVQQRTTPVDLYRGGRHTNIDERAELARAYGPPPQSNSVQLLMQRKALERNVGLPGTGRIGRRELTTAQMVDQVMQTNPFMTTEQAEFLVRQMLDRRRGF